MKPPTPNRRKTTRLFVVAILAMIVAFAWAQGYTAINYLEPDHPFFKADYAPAMPETVESLTVVSYNIWFALDIDQAISELEQIRSEKGLDVLLLQEMDEAAAEKISRDLHLNYIYYPAAIEPTYDKNFGNAVLSRWPIIDSQKIILPHKSLSNRMSRTATRATIQVNDMEIVVYSLHTESVFTLPQFREDQFKAVLDDFGPQPSYVIVGGDFNTFTGTAVDRLERDYQEAGLVRVSADGGNTVFKLGIGLASDHIFARGFALEQAGTWSDATASDHLPVWVSLRFEH